MNVEKISNPQWADAAHTMINCMVKFEGFEKEIPFTATKNDNSEHGKAIYAVCTGGDAGQISEFVPPPLPSPEEARTVKTAEINDWRNKMESGNYVFTFKDRNWDYGKGTQGRLEPSVAAAKAGTLPDQFFWTDADNNDVPVTAEELIELSEAAIKAMFAKGMEIHVRQRTMKKELEKLTSADEILAYKVGWGQA
ncbi:DUF4376 domain-containing protein [Escherichia coli]|nr:DUF4376 domain-containing protein [Escherichia coli]EKY5531680.1 DUF4376 domain-containing protein [Escherichia coli]ELT2929176.1 DUF4376 domain-containing protein [Escherichia coli]